MATAVADGGLSEAATAVTVETERVTRERLTEWTLLLSRAHATPALLLAIGHDEHEGEVHVLVPEGLDALTLIGLLQIAIKELAERVPMRADLRSEGDR